MSIQRKLLQGVLRLCVPLLAVLAVLLAFEASLWVTGVAPALLHFAPPSFYQADSELIYSLRPGGALDTNSAGLRGPEISATARGPRLVVLGDSYTYGHQVDYPASYPAQLQRQINREHPLEPPVEVINGGVPGYNMDQAYVLFSTRLAKFEPDWLVIAIEPKDLAGASVLFDLEGGELVPVSARKNWIYLQLWLRTNVPEWLRSTHIFRFLLGRLTGSDPFGTLPSRDLDHQIDWQIRKIQRMLERLVARGERDGFELFILNYPDRLALAAGGDYTQSTYFGFPTSILGPRGNEHMDRLRDVVLATGAHYVDAMQIFLERGYDPEKIAALYLPDDPHMTPRGNAVLAELIADAIAGSPPRS